MPVTRVVYPLSEVPLYVMRTMRLPSAAVCMKYTKWLPAQFGSNATPSSPPSPFVVTTLGTVPTRVFVAPVVLSLYTRNCPPATLSSRSVTRADCPSGAKEIPQGMVQPVEYVEIADGTPPLQELVVKLTVLLGADT